MRTESCNPVTFFSKRLTPVECNYDICDKELMATGLVHSETLRSLNGLIAR